MLRLSGLTAQIKDTRLIIPPRFLPLGLLVITLALAFLVYWPGLPGTFVLDDRQNLHRLGTITSVSDFASVAKLLTASESGPLGRPVSLATFALQHADWPSNPFAFKIVNLLLHLVNGLLLFFLLRQAALLYGAKRETAEQVALIATAIWLLHPLQVSTVLYVVQRMTELSATFTLAALVAYLHGRKHIIEGVRKGYLWMSLGIALGLPLAALSKETGALLPLYLLVIETTLLRTVSRPWGWHTWALPFFYATLAALLGYLLMLLIEVLRYGYLAREFTPGERIMTEWRVLLSYLANLFIPRPSAIGLFHDDYSISKSVLDPVTTLFAGLALSALLIVALYFRKRAPVLAFGILWYFAGHLLESTFIGLELYFEHRNYLPMVGPIFTVTYYVHHAWHRLPTRRYAVGGMAAAWYFLAVFVTQSEARLWAQPKAQAAVWASEKPNSKRAQGLLADYALLDGDYEKAATIYRQISTTHPNDANSLIILLGLGCFDDGIPLPAIEEIATRLPKTTNINGGIVALDEIAMLRDGGACQRLRYRDLVTIGEVMTNNPRTAPQHASVYLVLGKLAAAERLLDDTIKFLDKAYARSGRIDVILLQVEFLVSAGLYDDALRYLDKAQEAMHSDFVKNATYREEVTAWRSAVLNVAANKQQH